MEHNFHIATKDFFPLRYDLILGQDWMFFTWRKLSLNIDWCGETEMGVRRRWRWIVRVARLLSTTSQWVNHSLARIVFLLGIAMIAGWFMMFGSESKLYKVGRKVVAEMAVVRVWCLRMRWCEEWLSSRLLWMSVVAAGFLFLLSKCSCWREYLGDIHELHPQRDVSPEWSTAFFPEFVMWMFARLLGFVLRRAMRICYSLNLSECPSSQMAVPFPVSILQKRWYFPATHNTQKSGGQKSERNFEKRWKWDQPWNYPRSKTSRSTKVPFPRGPTRDRPQGLVFLAVPISCLLALARRKQGSDSGNPMHLRGNKYTEVSWKRKKNDRDYVRLLASKKRPRAIALLSQLTAWDKSC